MTLKFLRHPYWRSIAILGSLLVFDIAIHPLGIGPDRRIHDPAVYRLANPSYLPGDWYTETAVESGVYTFYAALVNFGPSVGIPEEKWRQGIYVSCLVLLYGALLRIGRLFSSNNWVIPLVAAAHAVLVLVVPPVWLYGPFIQIDGGLAPRSVGVAISFLALCLLLERKRFLPWILLGLATLIHVSNSLIIFMLFFGAWAMQAWLGVKLRDWQFWKSLIRHATAIVTMYLVAGGWFAAQVALQGSAFSSGFSTEKFIWVWTYFRAPYMALPLVRWEAWAVFGLHVAVFGLGWYLLRRHFAGIHQRRVDLLGYVGGGAIVFFFVFYVFTFVVPWLPGFQFYSLRVIYLLHFVTYFFAALVAILWAERWMVQYRISSRVAVAVIAGSIVCFLLTPIGTRFLERSYHNVMATWVRVQDLGNPIGPPPASEAVARYLFLHPEPFLAPPDWYGSPAYLPHVASFKTFGFTPEGLEQWYERINDVSGGELEAAYVRQRQQGEFRPIAFKWGEVYPRLTQQDVVRLAHQYRFRLFVSYRDKPFAFPVVAEDARYRLYRIVE